MKKYILLFCILCSYSISKGQKNINWILKPQYDTLIRFSNQNEYSIVQRDKKWSIFDMSGQKILSLQHSFHSVNQNFIVLKRKDKYAIINPKINKIKPHFIYDDISNINAALVPAKIGEKWGFISGTKNEDWAILPNFDTVMPFYELPNTRINVAKVMHEGKVFWIDTEGGAIDIEKEKKKRVIMPTMPNDTKTQTTIYNNPKLSSYIHAETYGNPVTHYLVGNSKYEYGVLDLAYNKIFDHKFSVIFYINNHIILGNIEYGNNINKDCIYDLKTQKEKFCYPKIITSTDNAHFISSDDSNHYGLIDTLGNIALPHQFQNISYLENGYYLMRNDGLFGFYDININEVVPIVLQQVLYPAKKDDKYTIWTKYKGKWGLMYLPIIDF